ncbi:MAG: N-acetylneuraminate synthase family protein [Deltaproteobacteria bacterium]|nr:N-acetylneuraminate synthase family protein [Deltaproteobacteria bacterium]
MDCFNHQVQIGQVSIAQNAPVCVIAEAGINHNARFPYVLRLIDVAADAGAAFVKFQTFRTDEFIADRTARYSYRHGKKRITETTYAMFKRLELPLDWYELTIRHCKKRRVGFLSTPCDSESALFLDKLGVNAFKISSEDLINIDFLECVAKIGKPVILSTGMADQDEIDTALQIFTRRNHKDVILLHCTSLYPTPHHEANLLRLVSLHDRYGVLTGYSDHTEGTHAAVVAVSLGARVIEKHITLSRTLKGPDHRFSLPPNALKKYIEAIRETEAILGDPKIAPAPSECEMRLKHRRSVVAALDLKKGLKLTQAHIVYKRPGHGLKPCERDRIIGKCLNRDIKKDQMILLKDVT